MLLKKKKIQNLAFMVSLAMLTSCGGGGSDPVAVQGDSANSDGGGTDEGSSPGPGGTDEGSSPGPGGTDEGSPDAGGSVESPPVSTGGRNIQALVAVGGPVTGAPGANMRTINDFEVNATGQFVFTGRYASGDNTLDAIWAGSIKAPRLLLSTGSPIEGIESNEGYGGTESFSLASDGSVAHVIKLTGPTGNDALVVSNSESQKVILETDAKLQGLVAEKTVGDFVSISHSPAATAIVANTKDSRSTVLWVYTNGTYTAVAENYDSSVDSAPTTDNTCRIFIKEGYSYQQPVRPRMLDNGSLVFQGYVRNYTSGSCTRGSAIVKYAGGSYQLLASEGKVVPGAPASTFNDLELLGVTDNGTSLVHATLETPTGSSSRPDKKWSFWAFPESGDPQLIALEGEAIQVGGVAENFSGKAALNYNNSGKVGFWSDFGETTKVSLFGGAAHAGQPHATIPAPGASSLQYVIDRTASLPAPFKGTDFFSTLGLPAVDSAGRLLFYGEITSSVLDKVTDRSIWQADLEGNITELVKEGDQVNIGGALKSIEDLVQRSTGYSANTGIPRVTNDGTLVFRADLARSSGDVIVYLEPASQ